MQNVISREQVVVEKQDFPSDALFHENIIGRFKENEQQLRVRKFKQVAIVIVVAALAGVVWSVIGGGDLYLCMSITVGIAGFYAVVLSGIQLLFGWQAWVIMGYRTTKALMLTGRNEYSIANYYSDLLFTDAIKNYLVAEEMGQLKDIQVNTDMGNRLTDTPIAKREVSVVGDVDFGSYTRAISVTLEFNDGNSQLTAKKYEISAVTEHNPTK